MKILYAAGNRSGSFFQMKRFLDTIQNHTIKIAAYKKSSGNINIDFTLDALLNFSGHNENIAFNGNFVYYCKEIEKFAPDLIISDFEIYTSIFAIEHNIPIWQVSPTLLYYALQNDIKYNLNINKYYGKLFNEDHRKKEYINFILNNSDKKFIYSHLCDTKNIPQLSSGFEWIRPNFLLGNNKKQFDNVCILKNNKNIINKLKNTNTIYFTDFTNEIYNKLVLHDIYDTDTYASCLSNASTLIYDGGAVFAADAFYNSIYSLAEPIFDDISSLVVSYINRYFGLGDMYKDFGGIKPNISIKLNGNVKSLEQLI